jgi:Cu-processing system ATP-binding protein
MIEIKNLHKKFGKLTVLNDVSFSIDKPGIYAILGPNGSGKTTLLKSILGMVIPQSGEIAFDGEQILSKWDYRRRIGFLPQIAQFPDNLTVREVISMIKNVRNEPASEEKLIDQLGIVPFLSKKLSNLSGGTRQKVNIVLTFMFDNQLLILDEPTAGLDPVSLVYLKELINEQKEKGKTLLITTHILNLVEELADEIIFLLEGEIYFKGTVEHLKKQTDQSDLEHAMAHLLTNHDKNT